MNDFAQLIENIHPTIKLTKREHKLLLALNDGVCSRNEILHECFGWATSAAQKATYKDTRSVDMTISRLKKKVGECGVIIQSIRGEGYRIVAGHN